MKSFEYVITDEVGMHARPAGLMSKQAAGFKCNISIANEAGKKVDAKRIMGVMSLGVKKGQKVVLEFDGDDEEIACEELRTFFSENL